MKLLLKWNYSLTYNFFFLADLRIEIEIYGQYSGQATLAYKATRSVDSSVSDIS